MSEESDPHRSARPHGSLVRTMREVLHEDETARSPSQVLPRAPMIKRIWWTVEALASGVALGVLVWYLVLLVLEESDDEG